MTASNQQGFFTTRQAQEAGYSQKNHAYHVKNGAWIRETRGIYRLARYPMSEEADLVKWSLWSANRRGVVQGVYSHQSALRIHDLTDLNPSQLNMTVPPAFRRSVPIPPVLKLHRATLAAGDIAQRPGYRLTKVLRTLEDLASEGSVTDEILNQGVTESLRKGSLTQRELAQSPLLAKFIRHAKRIATGRS